MYTRIIAQQRMLEMKHSQDPQEEGGKKRQSYLPFQL